MDYAMYSAQWLQPEPPTNEKPRVIVLSHDVIYLFVVLFLSHTQSSSLSIPSDDLMQSMYCKNSFFLSERPAYPFKGNNKNNFAVHRTHVSRGLPSVSNKQFFSASMLPNFLHAKPR